METFCFMPVDIFEPRTSRKSSIWSHAKIASIRSRSRAGGRPYSCPKYSTSSQAVMRS